MRKAAKVITSKLTKDRSPRSSAFIAAGVMAIILIGGYVMYRSSAAGYFAATDPESGTIGGNAQVVSDSSASGGGAVQFVAPAPPPPPPPSGCPTGQVGTPPNCFAAPPAPLASGKHWIVPFYEEFNGTDYDHNKLTPCFDWNYGDCTSSFNQGYEHYEPSAITVSGGLAHLMASPLPAPVVNGCGIDTATKCTENACLNGTCIYKSGLLSTARKSGNDSASAYLYKFTYGYVEANLRALNQQGFFLAWWMLPADPSYSYHYNGFRYEIDILEQLGHDPTDMQMHYSWGDDSAAYYSPNDASKNGACPDNVDYSQGLHRVGVDWEPTFVAWYIDGVKCGQHNATGSAPVPNVPMQLIMNQMVNVNWQRSIGKPLVNTNLSSDLQIDYIRVYQQAP